MVLEARRPRGTGYNCHQCTVSQVRKHEMRSRSVTYTLLLLRYREILLPKGTIADSALGQNLVAAYPLCS